MTAIRKTLCILLVIWLNSIFVSEPASAGEHGEMETFQNEKHGVHMRYPAGWHVAEDSDIRFYSLFISREALERPTDRFRTGISVIKQYDAPGRNAYVVPEAPDSTRRLVTEMLCQEMIRGGQLLSRKHVMTVIAGKETVFSELEILNSFGEASKELVAVFYEEGTLVFVTMEARIEEFDALRPEFEKVLESMRLFG